MPGAEMFASLYKTEESLLRFMRGMHGFAALSARWGMETCSGSVALQQCSFISCAPNHALCEPYSSD
jgi:hypothetical protein